MSRPGNRSERAAQSMALTESVAQKLDVPPGVAAAIVQDMAGANPTNKKLSRHELAQKWGKDAEILGESRIPAGRNWRITGAGYPSAN